MPREALGCEGLLCLLSLSNEELDLLVFDTLVCRLVELLLP